MKLLYVRSLKATEKWFMPIQNWNLVLSQLAIHFEGRRDEVLTFKLFETKLSGQQAKRPGFTQLTKYFEQSR